MRTLAGVLTAAVLLLGASGASAATIKPVSTQDVENGSIDDPGCTLRDAIQAANTNASEPNNGCNGDNAGADTILLEGGKTYTLELHGVDDTNAKGDLDITGPVTIRSTGPGLATISAASNTFPARPNGADRAVDVLPSAGSVTLEGLRIIDGFVDNGEAIGGGGGGILNEADLTVRDSEVLFNKVQGTGEVLGGGIYSRGTLAHLTVTGSTIANNEAFQTGNTEKEAIGGGIASYQSSKTMAITNSTISANKAEASTFEGSGLAGGVFAGDFLDFPVTTLTNVTITENKGTNVGGIEVQQGTISGSLIAGNTDSREQLPDCDNGGATSGGGNILGNEGADEDNCGFTAPTDLVGPASAPISPNLGTLVDNGGPTRTQVPNTGSPAIDRGGPCPETDQRGLFRAAAPPCDSGAVEVGASTTPPKEPPVETPPTETPPSGGGTSPTPPPTTAPPAPPAPPAAVAPARVVVTGKAKVSGGVQGRLTVLAGIEAACPAGGGTCTGTVAVKAAKGGAGLGSSGLALPAGATRAVKVKLSRAVSDQLRSTEGLKAKITVTLTAPGTAAASLTRGAKLKPPPRSG